MITQALKINKVAFHFTAVFVVFRSNLKFLEQNTKIKSLVLRKLASTRYIDDDVKSETWDNFGLSTERNILPVHGQQYPRTCLCAARETLNSLSL